MAEELKACPFCGGIPKTSHRPESEASGGGHVAFVVCYCGGYASTAHQMGHAETVQAAIAEVVEKWNTRALPPGQGGEAVEVVAYLNTASGEVVKYGPTLMDWDDEQEPVEPLMTVAQHQRILAAATHPADQVAEPDTELVELLREARELIEHGDFREGHCMCGSAVEAHGFGDGHSPVDAGVYYAGQVMERIDALLAKSEVVKK